MRHPTSYTNHSLFLEIVETLYHAPEALRLQFPTRGRAINMRQQFYTWRKAMWESEDFNEYLLTEEGAVVRSMACAIEEDTLTFTREAIGNLTLRAALDAHREKLGLPRRLSEALIPPPPPPPED